MYYSCWGCGWLESSFLLTNCLTPYRHVLFRQDELFKFQMPDTEFKFENDQKDIGFYSVEEGDTIHARWWRQHGVATLGSALVDYVFTFQNSSAIHNMFCLVLIRVTPSKITFLEADLFTVASPFIKNDNVTSRHIQWHSVLAQWHLILCHVLAILFLTTQTYNNTIQYNIVYLEQKEDYNNNLYLCDWHLME